MGRLGRRDSVRCSPRLPSLHRSMLCLCRQRLDSGRMHLYARFRCVFRRLHQGSLIASRQSAPKAIVYSIMNTTSRRGGLSATTFFPVNHPLQSSSRHGLPWTLRIVSVLIDRSWIACPIVVEESMKQPLSSWICVSVAVVPDSRKWLSAA